MNAVADFARSPAKQLNNVVDFTRSPYQKAGNLDSILLDKPVADIALKNGGNVALQAGEGTYNQKASELLLKGDVQMRHTSGYEIRTNQMNINVTSQSISSDQDVSGHAPSADMEAKGLEANGETDMVIFKGPAKLTLRQAPAEPIQERTKNDELSSILAHHPFLQRRDCSCSYPWQLSPACA